MYSFIFCPLPHFENIINISVPPFSPLSSNLSSWNKQLKTTVWHPHPPGSSAGPVHVGTLNTQALIWGTQYSKEETLCWLPVLSVYALDLINGALRVSMLLWYRKQNKRMNELEQALAALDNIKPISVELGCRVGGSIKLLSKIYLNPYQYFLWGQETPPSPTPQWFPPPNFAAGLYSQIPHCLI